MLNILLGTIAVALSIPLGILLALGRKSNMPIIKWICVLLLNLFAASPDYIIVCGQRYSGIFLAARNEY